MMLTNVKMETPEMEDTRHIYSAENVLQVYVADDIQKLLRLGKSNAYAFIKKVYEDPNPPFRVIKIGRLFRIPKAGFDSWMNSSNSSCEVVS